MTSLEIEIAVASYFNFRQCLIVPNVSWGWGLVRSEADMVVLRPSGYALEVEIKVSKSDCKADMRKRHCHDSRRFRQLYFAVPEQLKDCEYIPERAGILYCKYVRELDGLPTAIEYRKPYTRKDIEKIKDKDRLKLAELGSMRIWDLKRILISRIKEIPSDTQH